MLNDHLAGEEAKERIKQSLQNAESDRLFRQLGYSTDKAARWIIFLIIIAVVTIGLMV
ncbi:MAG: hypothetical protein QM730_12655 [Anaerolineales bacterium]